MVSIFQGDEEDKANRMSEIELYMGAVREIKNWQMGDGCD